MCATRGSRGLGHQESWAITGLRTGVACWREVQGCTWRIPRPSRLGASTQLGLCMGEGRTAQPRAQVLATQVFECTAECWWAGGCHEAQGKVPEGSDADQPQGLYPYLGTHRVGALPGEVGRGHAHSTAIQDFVNVGETCMWRGSRSVPVLLSVHNMLPRACTRANAGQQRWQPL